MAEHNPKIRMVLRSMLRDNLRPPHSVVVRIQPGYRARNALNYLRLTVDRIAVTTVTYELRRIIRVGLFECQDISRRCNILKSSVVGDKKTAGRHANKPTFTKLSQQTCDSLA